METLEKTSVDELFEKIKDIKICMLTTREANGELRSRPMGTTAAEEEDHELWFFTNESSEKINEITYSDKVNISYANTPIRE